MRKKALGALVGTAAITAALTVAPTFTNFAWALPSFPDVTTETSHHEHIAWLAGTGITTGYPDGSFRPMEMVYRQDMAAFLYRLAGQPVFTPTDEQKAAFSDVTDETPHANEIWWLASTGISEGYPDGTFRPMEKIYRQDMAAFLNRLAVYLGDKDAKKFAPESFDAFTDVNADSDHAREIMWLHGEGISTGYSDKTFRGLTPGFRQDMAAFLHRLQVNVDEMLNANPDAKTISMTSRGAYSITIPVEGVSLKDLEKAVDDGKVEWSLVREKGIRDQKDFPYQWLGGPLDTWKTFKSNWQDAQSFFTGVRTEATEVDGKPALLVRFNTEMFYGVDGIDGRDRAYLRNSILDYTGLYDLTAKVNDKAVGSTQLNMRAYESYRTQEEIDAELPRLVEEAKKNGLHAELKTIGKSARGRDIQALFVSKKASDLTDYQALAEQMETTPGELQKQVEAGTLQYKVPVMYSNVHADEIVGSDGVLEFAEALVKNKPIAFDTIESLTDTGKETLQKEMKEDGRVWSELIKDDVTGVGYIQGEGTKNASGAGAHAAVDMTEEEFAKYYNVDSRELDPSKVLDDVFFILVPSENPDGRYDNLRTGGNGLDLNRDNTYQTQPETQAMTHLIATWNPISFHEIHGYYTQYQVEPCSPTHDPNNEYDLFIDTALRQGEAFQAASISNNETINSVQMPMRDYLTIDEEGNRRWEPFDDMSSSYTPQYAMLHGVNAYTVELPYGNEDAVTAIKYGFVGNAEFVANNKDEMFLNQLERYERGINNVDSDDIRPWYVSQSDEVGAEADVFRPRYEENDNFFPEFYAIPTGVGAQQDRAAVNEMVEYLLRNDVKVQRLTEDLAVGDKTLKAGDLIVDMHQAKRNMANAALYKNMVVANWTDMYSEPVTNFPDQRGFDVEIVTTVGALDNAKLEDVTGDLGLKTVVDGEGAFVRIENSGVEAIRAVNALLKADVKVGLITDGEFKGDYVVNEADFGKVSDEFVLDAHKTADAPTAKNIKNDIKVYIPLGYSEFMENREGKPFGLRNYYNRLNTDYNWDRFALAEQMGFTLVDSPEEADIIVGNQGLSEADAKLIKEGKPYVGYTYGALDSVKELIGLDLDFYEGWGHDALTTVEYVDQNSMTTATYRAEGDDLVYFYGGSHITKLPEGAVELMKITDDEFIEGWMPPAVQDEYKGSTQAFDYAQDGMDMTIFANTLTNKTHQQDDYRFLTGALYSKLLGDDFKA